MKAVAVAGGSPDTPETPETEGTEVPEADPGTQDTAPEQAEAATPQKPEPEPDGDTETGSEEDAPGEPEAKAEAEPEPEAGAGADHASDSAAAETAPGADVESQPDTEAGPEAEADGGDVPEPETEAEAGAGADDASDSAAAETAPGAEAEARPDAEAEADGGDVPEPEAEPHGGDVAGSEAKADGGDVPEAEAEAEPEAEPGPEADNASDSAAAETAPGADVESQPDTEAGPEAEADGGDVPEPETEAEAGAGADDASDPAAAETAPGAEAEAQPDTEAGPEAEADGGDVPEPEAAPHGGDVAGSEAKADGGDVPESEAEAEPEAEPGPEADDASGSAAAETAPGAGAGAEARPDDPDDTEAEPEAAADAGDVSETEAEADGAGPDGGTPDDEADVAEADAADEADEAEESADPEPDDGGGRESRPVPSWARDGEADAERTSQFVALKELDAPARKAPWPGAVPQNRPAAGAATPAPAAAPAATPAPAPARAATPAPAPGRAAAPPVVVEPTREVPLPPQPPLDLLAELTNTAPAPETPRRTAVRRVKIWTPILLLLAGAVTGAQLLRPLPAPQLVAAEQVHALDGQFSVPWPAKGQGAVRVPGSGDIGTFGEQKPVPTASVAKVMTAYVVLKGHPLRKGDPGPQIEVDAKAVADGASTHESRVEGLVAGTKFSQQDMLKMLMIPSANNVARLLARWDSGTDSEAAFVEKMNAAARELGMTNTTYTDASGLDAGTVSTAADQLKLAEAVMKEEAFRAVVALPSADIKRLSTTLINNNILLSANGLSIRGIKTGSSTPAGGTLMWAAYKSVGDETPLILGTLMDQHVDGPDLNGENSLKLVLANSKKIIEAVRQALDSAPVVRKGQTVGHVDDGLGGQTPLVATKDLNVIGVPGQQLKLTLRPGAAATPHTAKAGTEVGVLTVGAGEGAKSVPVAVGTALAEPSFTTRVTRLR
ncbi:serine hydrolase [Streptomyces sp. NPDC051109]|uniref:serine hydrolase n=1 Tax=Streptomyces sp. NPDC051109 TaxID=3365642 RepID=UPI003791BC3B